MALDQCGLTSGCVDARVREAVRLELSTERPDEDQRCEFCCTPCEQPCILLAKIKLRPGKPIEEGDIDTSVRRRFGLYDPTVITEISWEHGATYTQGEAIKVLGTEDQTRGIVVRFSRPVRAETIKPGVFDLWYVTGGPGAAGSIMHKKGEYVDLPSSGPVDHVRYRDVTGETLQAGDRVIIIVRGSFILDACCQPVDAVHVGGKVPQALPSEDQNDGRNGDGNDGQNEEPYEDPNGKPDGETGKDPCAAPPGGFGPWTSGNGVPGGTFESWFYISRS